MKCPVCKTECTGYERCPQCGFNELNRIFINRDEALYWEHHIVQSYRNSFFSSTVGSLSFEDLSTEQKEALMLPFDKCCLIVGSAGTGKTTVGLHRASLTNGKVLYATKPYIAKCFAKELGNKSEFENVRFISSSSIVHEVWRELFDEKVPYKDNRWEIDMTAVNERILPFGSVYDCVILDIDAYGKIEYDFLKSIAKTVYALIDKNTIVDWLFNLDEFVHQLNITEITVLSRNFRNSYPISGLISKYKCSDVFSCGTREGEPVRLFQYPMDKNIKFGIIAKIIGANAGQKIGIVINFNETKELIPYLKIVCSDHTVVNCWGLGEQTSPLLSDEKYIGVASNIDLCNMEFDVVIVMLNDALNSMPDIDSANKRCLYQIFSIAKDKLYVGISNETPLKHQGQRIFDEMKDFEKFVDYQSVKEV